MANIHVEWKKKANPRRGFCMLCEALYACNTNPSENIFLVTKVIYCLYSSTNLLSFTIWETQIHGLSSLLQSPWVMDCPLWNHYTYSYCYSICFHVSCWIQFWTHETDYLYLYICLFISSMFWNSHKCSFYFVTCISSQI